MAEPNTDGHDLIRPSDGENPGAVALNDNWTKIDTRLLGIGVAFPAAYPVSGLFMRADEGGKVYQNDGTVGAPSFTLVLNPTPGVGLHGPSHQSGQSDEFNVGGLSGTLADPQIPALHGHPHSETTGQTATDHHDNSNDPSADEKAALAGTSGTPSGSNKFVTDGDARIGFGNDYQTVIAVVRTTTTLSAPQTKVSLTTPGLTGTYRVSWSAVVDNSGFLGDSRLQNITDVATIGATRVFKAGDAAERQSQSGFAEVVFAGVAKTFEIQFNDQASGNTQGIQDARIEIWKVKP